MKNIKIGDIVIICFILLITAGVFCFRIFRISEGETVLISVGGHIEKYDIGKNQSIDIDNNGVSMTVVINERQVYVKSTDCPEKSCMIMGKITDVGQCIACVPARVYIKIDGEGSLDYDYVVG